MSKIKTAFLILCLVPIVNLSVLAQKNKTSKKTKAVKSTVTDAATSQQKVMAEFYFVEGMKFLSLNNIRSAQAHFEKAYTLEPNSDGLNYMLAKTYFFNANYAKALSHIQKSLKSDPKNREYYLVQAKILEAQKNYPEAIKTYKKMIAETKGGEKFYFDLAQVQLDSKDYPGAISSYNKIEEIYGKSLEITRQKQKIWQAAGKTDEAVKEGQALIKAYPTIIEYQVAQAEMLYYAQRKTEAFDLLQNILKKDPNNVQAHVMLYQLYRYDNDLENALKSVEWIIRSPDTDRSIKQEVMKDILVNAKSDSDKKSALQLAERFYEQYPTDGTAILIYGDALFVNNQKEKAWIYYGKATHYFPENFNVWIQVMSLDYEFQKYDSLTIHGTRAIEYFPNQAAVWYFTGIGHYFSKNYTKAAEALLETKNLAASNNEVKTNALLMLGDTYNELKKYTESDAAFEEVLKMDRYNIQALNNYSYYLSLRKEKLDLAKEMSERVVNRNPNEVTYVDTYAWVLYQMKDYKGAKAQLEKFMTTTESATILEHYGDILFQLGDVKGAVEYWKKAKAKGSDTSEFIDKKIADQKLYE
ncbi:MAG: tetratricopeptide repeat protein [Cytophagaceae bacterium]|jgi:tetratricopeptide (TPR) repeat protein|nr:tetratricopeptide repeat protein [Cytophagaceae bacterium]